MPWFLGLSNGSDGSLGPSPSHRAFPPPPERTADLQHGPLAGLDAAQPMHEPRADCDELDVVSEPTGTRGYRDLRRAATRDPLGSDVGRTTTDRVRALTASAGFSRATGLRPSKTPRRDPLRSPAPAVRPRRESGLGQERLVCRDCDPRSDPRKGPESHRSALEGQASGQWAPSYARSPSPRDCHRPDGRGTSNDDGDRGHKGKSQAFNVFPTYRNFSIPGRAPVSPG
jgi:hypothetical protein